MKSKPCIGGGVLTAIPDWNAPVVIAWGADEDEAEYRSAKEHIDLSHLVEDAEARLARDAEHQAWEEYRKIRAKA
jgi:hypothetical protein